MSEDRPTFAGTVIKGLGEAGRIYGAATANIDTANITGIDHGIYAGVVESGGNRYGAAICYGDEFGPKFEVHIIDFEGGDLLGTELKGEIVQRVGEYVTQYSVERLRQKILHDIELCRDVLKEELA